MISFEESKDKSTEEEAEYGEDSGKWDDGKDFGL